MKFFLDENLPLSSLDAIQKLGFKAEHVKTVGLQGRSDKTIAEYAKKQQAILITKDLEFGSLTVYPKNSHYGVIILRLPHYFTAKQIIDALNNFLTKIRPETLAHTITVLEVGRYRSRDIS